MFIDDTWVNRVLTALARAHYPTPHITHADGYTALMWGWKIPDGAEQPQIAVFDGGTVVIDIDRHPDAIVHVDEIDAWLRVMHPRIAAIIAHSMMRDPIPDPSPLPWASLPAFAFLDDAAAGVYATFADRSRLWVSAADGLAALDALLGTVVGYQLGITVATAAGVATRDGIVYLNPQLADPTAIPSMTGYQPALAIADAIFALPHPVSTHHVTPAHAAHAAADHLITVMLTQAEHGHIYRHNG